MELPFPLSQLIFPSDRNLGWVMEGEGVSGEE